MTTKRKARQEGKGRVMYCCAADFAEHKGTAFQPFECTESPTTFGHTTPVAVLTLSESADAARIEAVRKALSRNAIAPINYRFDNKAESWAEWRTRIRALEYAQATACLTAIGALSTPARSTKQG